jgi:plasmid stabilization system protein ParE
VSRPVVLRAEAETEFDEAFDYYDARRAGLGTEFVSEVQRVFERIAANPLIHQEVFADIRKAVVRRFPYCVFYRPHPDRVEVLSVFHTSRDPSVWQGRAGP